MWLMYLQRQHSSSRSETKSKIHNWLGGHPTMHSQFCQHSHDLALFDVQGMLLSHVRYVCACSVCRQLAALCLRAPPPGCRATFVAAYSDYQTVFVVRAASVA